MILPEPEDHSPAMARSSEVFPAPLAPTTSSDSPDATCEHLPHSVPDHCTMLWPADGVRTRRAACRASACAGEARG